MINIQTYSQNTSNLTLREINRGNSILIIGRGNTARKLNDILKPKNSIEVISLYGESELSKAYEDAINYGAENVFVMNCLKTTDFRDSISFARNYNFSFIVPVGINLSDTYYDSEKDRDVYFAELYLTEFSKYTNGLIIFTDRHSDLYQDVDHFLNDMQSKVNSFKDNTDHLLLNSGRNLAFCLNNLTFQRFANIAVAVALSKTVPGNYPDPIIEEAYFDMDKGDVLGPDIIYFKNNFSIPTTIENLKNFRTNYDANKLIAIDMVIKYIERNLDTSFVIGKLYNQYVKMNLEDYLDAFFRSIEGTLIRSFQINGIEAIRDTVDTMAINIVSDITIHPINSLEEINILLEVR